MPTQKVDLKTPWIAGLLAYLIPGAGHFYQGRYFKAAIYSVCILGTFFWGLALGQWRIVYQKWEPGSRNIGYLSQVLVGLPALPAYFQAGRYKAQFPDDAQRPHSLLSKGEERLNAPFQGIMPILNEAGNTEDKVVIGTITLTEATGPLNISEVSGTIVGSVDDQANQELTIRLERIQPKIFGDPHRLLEGEIIESKGDEYTIVGRITGAVPRSFWDWFEVPLEDQTLDELNRDLGKMFELAQVFTWIAGLLNLLAVWDALEGPAYGYGDESKLDNGQGGSDSKTDAEIDHDATTKTSSAEKIGTEVASSATTAREP